MKKIDIVLGLGFGDEGKGNITNALARKNSMVVQFNGGHQKGHTVVHNNIEHVFSSFGAGTLKGAATYIDKRCVVNPIAFINEYKILREKGIIPVVYIHPEAMLATPFDIEKNQIPGEYIKNGTVGVGFGHTIERNEKYYHLPVRDIEYSEMLKIKFELIALKYYGYASFELNNNRRGQTEWFDAINEMKKIVAISNSKYIIDRYSHIIFEGSQGIMLDQHYGFFPYVTRSNTTSQNVFEILDDVKANITTYYVTRAYVTRHGNGSIGNSKTIELLYNDVIDKRFRNYMPKLEDDTNKFNKYQGEFRKGFLSINTLKYALKIDEKFNDTDDKRLVITCMDHLAKKYQNKIKTIDSDGIMTYDINELEEILNLEIITSKSKEMEIIE